MSTACPPVSHTPRRVSCPQLPCDDTNGLRAFSARTELPELPVRRSQSLKRFTLAPRRVSMDSVLTETPLEGETARTQHEPSASEQTPEEQQFDRMMERFQLRRVSVSSASPASGTGHRNSMDRSTAVLTARRTSRLPSVGGDGLMASVAEPEALGEQSERELVSAFKQHTPFTVDVFVQWIHTLLTSTFEQTSLATRVRLALLATVLMARVLYMPFVIAYKDYEVTAIELDGVIDAVFLLNILATCNTQTTSVHRQLLTSRRAIWRHYRHNGFFSDLLAALPWEYGLLLIHHPQGVHWFVGAVKLTRQSTCVWRHILLFHSVWSKEVMASDTSAAASMLFTRYSHLLRIGRILLVIVLVTHYVACMWSWLHIDIDADFFAEKDTMALHLDSIYVALQLLQGQGMETKTPAQAAFGSVAVLLGSIAVAVMFGNVAILVANFSASATAYQRRMEHVFAIMGKLELPHAIRERVHQYYEHLHTEYELLDGEIVKFAKDLSHTLTLETVLFRYMDVLVNVPHWHGCSPDFQKQLVLSLCVRIYLPDDFIMRRGEVGAECFLINRGTCKLYEYASGTYESPTPPMATEAVRTTTRRQRRQSAVQESAHVPLFQGAAVSGNSDRDGVDNGLYSRVSELSRGQAIGDFALVANYQRSSDLRAVTYVEVCVIERESFQRILTRYPADRRVVVTSIVRHRMKSVETQTVACPLLTLVQQVVPQASVNQAVEYISRAMDSAKDDPSIVFGMSEQLLARVRKAVKAEKTEEAEGGDTVRVAVPVAATPSVGVVASRHEDENLWNLLRGIQESLTRLEAPFANCVCSSPPEDSGRTTAPITPQRSDPRARLRRTSSALASIPANSEAPRPSEDRPSVDQEARPLLPSVQAAELSANRHSPSRYADELFGAGRAPVVQAGDAKRSNLRRMNSTR